MSEPTVVIGDAALYLADCRDVIPLIPHVDGVITDPPYEAHMHAAKRGVKVRGAIKRIRKDGHANPAPLDFSSIGTLREEIVAPLIKICTGWFLAFCTPEGVTPWRDALEAGGAKYKRACVWVKPDAAPQFNGQGPAMGAEMFVAAWCGSGHSKWNGGGRRNVFTHLTNSSERDGLHPTEKPLPLMRELVGLFCNAGDVVLDPFMGSGTTGLACLRGGRRFIGIENDEKYFDVAVRRLKRLAEQPDIFIAHKKAQQGAML